jgi:hypothetical protein
LRERNVEALNAAEEKRQEKRTDADPQFHRRVKLQGIGMAPENPPPDQAAKRDATEEAGKNSSSGWSAGAEYQEHLALPKGLVGQRAGPREEEQRQDPQIGNIHGQNNLQFLSGAGKPLRRECNSWKKIFKARETGDSRKPKSYSSCRCLVENCAI